MTRATSQDTRAGIIFWSLLLVIAIWQIINAYIDPGISMGEFLGILLTVILALISSIWVGTGVWRNRFPLKMHFSNLPPGHEGFKDFGYRIDRLTGTSKIYVRINTKISTEISDLNLRFVKKQSFLPPKNVKQSIAEIVAISVYKWDEDATFERDIIGSNEPKCEPDTVGGLTVKVPKSKIWDAGDPLWLTVNVKVQEPFTGYLSFRSRRKIARRKVQFRKSWHNG